MTIIVEANQIAHACFISEILAVLNKVDGAIYAPSTNDVEYGIVDELLISHDVNLLD